MCLFFMGGDFFRDNTYFPLSPEGLGQSHDVAMNDFPTTCIVSKSYGESAIKALQEDDAPKEQRKEDVHMTSFEKQVTRELGKSAIRALDF